MSENKSIKFVFQDPEFWAILLFNAFLIYSYYTDIASAKVVIISFHLQSMIIGLQAFIRMMAKGISMAPKTSFSKRFGSPFFFAFHFGIFHFVYTIFIIAIVFRIPGPTDFSLIFWLAIFMMVNMLLSVVSDIKKDLLQPVVVNTFMFQPYLRIFPMHIFIIIGFNKSVDDMENAFMVFILLKTLADLLMHVIINQTYIQRRPRAIEGWI